MRPHAPKTGAPGPCGGSWWQRWATASFPALTIASGIILSDFAQVASPWSDVARPIFLTSVLALAIGGVASRLMSPLWAVLAPIVLVVGPTRPIVALWIVAGLIAWVAIDRWRLILFGKRVWNRTRLVRALTVLGGSFAIASLTHAVTLHGIPAVPSSDAVHGAGGAGDSVYILLLDGYPRADTLLDDFGYDNTPFLQGLQQRGLQVDHDSEALYVETAQALAHLLGLESAAASGAPTGSDEYRNLRRQFADAPTLVEWRRAGYDVTIIRSAMGHVAIEGSLDTGQANDFEVALLGRSALSSVARDWVLDQQRERLHAALDALSTIADRDGPQVVLAHIMAPHPPFLSRPAPACWPRCGLWHKPGISWEDAPDAYAAAVAEQLDYLNPRVLAAIDRVIAADPQAALIVFSDHGPRHGPGDDAHHRRSLHAIRGEPSVPVPVPRH